MKTLIVIICSFWFCTNAFAQNASSPGSDALIRIRCVATIPNEKPLWIIYSNNKIVFKSDSMPKGIIPKIIKSINVLKSDGAIKEYGSLATNGVIVIHIDDEKFPNAFKFINVKLIGRDSTKLEKDF
jgi:hypothetical protein